MDYNGQNKWPLTKIRSLHQTVVKQPILTLNSLHTAAWSGPLGVTFYTPLASVTPGFHSHDGFSNHPACFPACLEFFSLIYVSLFTLKQPRQNCITAKSNQRFPTAAVGGHFRFKW